MGTPLCDKTRKFAARTIEPHATLSWGNTKAALLYELYIST